jgi:hypothetical protein
MSAAYSGYRAALSLALAKDFVSSVCVVAVTVPASGELPTSRVISDA